MGLFLIGHLFLFRSVLVSAKSAAGLPDLSFCQCGLHAAIFLVWFGSCLVVSLVIIIPSLRIFVNPGAGGVINGIQEHRFCGVGLCALAGVATKAWCY